MDERIQNDLPPPRKARLRDGAGGESPDSGIQVRLKESSGLRRLLDVDTPEGLFFVEYNGRGLGYESVLVNGRVVCQPASMLWFVPHFEFALGGHRAEIDVRVWVWLRIRRFRLWIDNELVYEE